MRRRKVRNRITEITTSWLKPATTRQFISPSSDENYQIIRSGGLRWLQKRFWRDWRGWRVFPSKARKRFSLSLLNFALLLRRCNPCHSDPLSSYRSSHRPLVSMKNPWKVLMFHRSWFCLRLLFTRETHYCDVSLPNLHSMNAEHEYSPPNAAPQPRTGCWIEHS